MSQSSKEDLTDSATASASKDKDLNHSDASTVVVKPASSAEPVSETRQTNQDNGQDKLVNQDSQTDQETTKDSEGGSEVPDITPDVKTDGNPPPKEPIPSAKGWSPKKKSIVSLIALISLLFVGVLLILYTWKLPPFIPTVQQTDNAFIKGKTTIISPQVSGYVTEVLASDFETVKAGQVLVKIDDRSFAQQLEQAQANIEVSLTNLSSNDQDTGSSQAQINARMADLNSAKVSVASAAQDVARYEGLDQIGAVSKAEVMHTKAQLAKAEAAVEQAKANLQAAIEAGKKTTGSKASLGAQVKNAEAAAKQAQINLQNTIIKAPEAGQLSQVSVKPGQYVNAGAQLMYIVPEGTWVIANFKETQVKNIKIGEAATIRVDALGGQTFKGHVSNLSPATGSELSTGATNPATGNYIKVAQRIPVRIDLEAGQEKLGLLRPGMSVVASVNTESSDK
ncbi:MAG: HlyD family secretion protein [Psychrobacter sp.]|nr:HlyD family secretion protein [Psychrobacter sp.]